MHEKLSYDLKKVLPLIGISLIISVALAEAYMTAGLFRVEAWLHSALINTALSGLVLGLLIQKKFPLAPVKIPIKKTKNYYFLILAYTVVLVGSGLFTRIFIEGAERSQSIEFKQVMWVVWIPIVEEIVFRGGISNLLRQYYNSFWASYFSVFIFAFLHSMPTMDRLLSFQVGIPLGPLLLGAACEFLYQKTGRIFPCILLHALGNFSVIWYLWIDVRWLDWLDAFYL